MLIGVDIDGVLFPWEEAVRGAIERKFGTDYGPMMTWDDYYERLRPEEWEWVWTPEGSEAVLRQTWRTYPGIIEAIREVMEAGHEVHFATHRDPYMTCGWTASFLRRHFHGLRWYGLHVTRSTVAKRTLAPWDVFIDDKPDTVWDFLANTNAQVFAPARAWNEELVEDVQFGHKLIRYDDPRQVAEWVLR